MTIDTRSNQYGKVLGDWHIREKIGWGAKGTVVYRITKRDRDGIWEEVCALKAIPLIQEWGKLDALSPERREEYYRAVRKRKAIAREEVKAMEKVRGESNIVTYIDSDAVEWETENAFGCDFLIRMEYLHDLRQLLDSDKVFSEPEIIRIGTDICHAIGECHRVDILHRDIKPENIFISDSGKYKLGDFGIARIMDACPDAWASTGIGTPEYAAPEQGSGKYDRRVDIYSLGLVLYELANGNRLPFAQSKYLNGDEIQRRLSNEPLPPPSGVSQALGEVILKACAFDPADRYQSATEFLTALQAVSAAAGPETQDPDIHVTIPIPANEKLPKQIPVRFQDKTVRVEIPKGVRNGTVIRVPGGGRWDPASGRSGDLLVTVQLKPPSGGKHSPSILMGVLAGMLVFLILAAVLAFMGRKREPWTEASAPATAAAAPSSEPAPTAPTETLPPETQPPRHFVAIDGGQDHTVILYSDGTVKAVGSNKYGQCEVSRWTDIVQISTQGDFTVGLKSDGTVVATGDNSSGQCNVTEWRDIVSVSAGVNHTVGLKADGSVVAAGANSYGQCNARNWTDMESICAGVKHTAGRKKDGTVIAVGYNEDDRCNVGSWYDLEDLCAGAWHTVALKKDGSVKYCGYGGYSWNEEYKWTNIISINAGNAFTVGLDADGNVHVGGVNDVGQHDADQWTDIVYIAAGPQHIIGVKADGSVLTVGANDYGQRDITTEDLFPEQ